MADRRASEESGELAVRGASYVESFVALIRDKAVRPILVGARVAIVALVAVCLCLVVGAALLIGLVRLFTSDVFGGRVWATDLLFGGILVGVGVFLISHGLRRNKGARHE